MLKQIYMYDHWSYKKKQLHEGKVDVTWFQIGNGKVIKISYLNTYEKGGYRK